MLRFDVIIPCYNYGRYLRHCVRSALDQRGVSTRVLVIDDASSDDSAEIGRALAESDSRVEFRRHSANHGHIATYNEGLDWADGDCMLLLSADDALTPGAFERVARVMQAHPEVGLVYGRRILWSDAGSPPFIETPDRPWGYEVLTGARFLETMCATAKNPVCTPTATVRTAVQKTVGHYRKALPHTGDYEMWLRFAVYSSVGMMDSEQAYWRQHPENMRKLYRGTVDFRQHKAAFDLLFEHYRGLIHDAECLQTRVNRRLAEMAFWSADTAFERGDMECCKECLAIAREFDPGICSWRPWSRMRYKRALGPRLYRAMSRALRAVREWRGAAPSSASTTVASQAASCWEA